MTSSGPVTPETREISIGLIDEPDLPTRETINPEKLEELARDIQRNGLINAVSVEQRGQRYTILAGHRRFAAHKLINAQTVRCSVYPEGVTNAIAIQAQENANREKVNPAEEGEWLEIVLRDRCDGDIDKLCRLLNLSYEYVSDRLLIVRGDALIRDAVRDGKMSKGVAVILNDIKRADHREYFARSAVENGCSIRTAKLWRAQSESMAASGGYVDATAAPAESSSGPSYVVEHRCVCCGGSHDVPEMEYVQVHRYCHKAILEPAMRARRSQETPGA